MSNVELKLPYEVIETPAAEKQPTAANAGVVQVTPAEKGEPSNPKGDGV